MVEAAKAAHIHSYIRRLPDGYNTILTEDGVNISKGQKQLLTIARAMLLDSKMLILDEATSNVDTRTELRIQKAMELLGAQHSVASVAEQVGFEDANYFSAAFKAGNIHLSTWLCEREVMRSELNLSLRTKQFLGKLCQCSLQVRESYIFINNQSFNLMERG